MAAALLLLAGCGTTSTQTTTQSVPESEAAKFGNKVVDMLNGGKAKALFDLWEGSDELDNEPLADAVMPDAKAKGIKWEYKSGDFGSQEGSITLKWITKDKYSKIEYKTEKVDGKWRLIKTPLVEIDACGSATIDGNEVPVVEAMPNNTGPCLTSDGGFPTSKDGQAALVVPGEHKISLHGFDGIFKQPFKAMVYPGVESVDATCEENGEYGCKTGLGNLLPSDMMPVGGYAEAVKEALIESVDCSDGCYGSNGNPIDYQPIVFNDDLTVTPTDNPLKPTFGGTAQISTEDTSKTVNVADLDIDLTFDGYSGVYAAVYSH
ncbi:hypothetical protein [Bifidobacterium moukalabense]|uniref:hypothetical protein n=1 Tax=Bifidobacterium moukalabense TaxID=1333651 RepID=UPI0010FA53D2|nr:hypothetical protein [Bifidobacterium moukalabense]